MSRPSLERIEQAINTARTESVKKAVIMGRQLFHRRAKLALVADAENKTVLVGKANGRNIITGG